jgi:hypothetical protein
MASALSSMKAVCDKEGIDPGQCHEHHIPHSHQRRRWPRGSRSKDRGAQPHRPSLPRASPCPGRPDRNADAHLKRHGPRRVAVVAVTNGRLDGFAEGSDRAQSRASPKSLGRGRGSCVSHPADPGVRRAAAEAGVGQDCRGVGALRAILHVLDCGSGVPQSRDGLCDNAAGAESLTLSPGLKFGLEPGGPIRLC